MIRASSAGSILLGALLAASAMHAASSSSAITSVEWSARLGTL
jgi:hypothetical protein